MKTFFSISVLAAVAAVFSCPLYAQQINGPKALALDDLGVGIVPGESREYSYSDKEAGFYYGQTSADDFSEWYQDGTSGPGGYSRTTGSMWTDGC